MNKKLYDQYKEQNPETVGEQDKEYDKYCYQEWMENKLLKIQELLDFK